MPLAFHDSEDVRALGAAGFLHVEPVSPEDATRFGALFFVNARGEPLEFVHNRLELLGDALWRREDRLHAAVSRLSASLFRAAALTPAVLLCRADAVGPELFGAEGHIKVVVPVVRVSRAGEGAGHEVEVTWCTGRPEGSASVLFDLLAERGLLLEPFERAAQGLREVYGDPLGSAP
jgi:hypothetical protein